MLLAVIAGCEIAFWVLLAAGMSVRYLLRLPRIGAVLLAGVPLVDVVLLAAGVVDLQRGGEPSFNHSLAAIFIGVSVGFGHQTIRWADRWAAYLLSSAPRPARPPKDGPERARRERQGWYRHLLAWAVAVGLMGLGALLAGFDDSTALLAPAWPWTIVLVIDFFVSFSYQARPERPKDSRPDEALKVGQ
jgi:hypothetical protein